MNALNIMWLLNEIDNNTSVDIRTVKSKSCDWIEIETNDYKYEINEFGKMKLHRVNVREYCISEADDHEYWQKVKDWVKKYYSKNF